LTTTLLLVSGVVKGAEPSAPQTMADLMLIALNTCGPAANFHFGSSQILNILIVSYQKSLIETQVSTQAL